uniref:Uncharacterized protein n=1 Tax=Oryza meridionalis TaxID=40149 RepID=A0A0E0DLU7_9ORYZ
MPSFAPTLGVEPRGQPSADAAVLKKSNLGASWHRADVQERRSRHQYGQLLRVIDSEERRQQSTPLWPVGAARRRRLQETRAANSARCGTAPVCKYIDLPRRGLQLRGTLSAAIAADRPACASNHPAEDAELPLNRKRTFEIHSYNHE